jgi:murein DD-endopeptidase MepM/ murein hydrolase activator NlpD
MRLVKPLRRRSLAFVLLTIVSLTQGILPAYSVDEEEVEQSRQEREAAARERAAALEDLEAAVSALEALRAELEEVTFRVGRVRSQIDSYESQSRDLRDLIRERAVDSYMHGDERDVLSAVFNPAEVQQSIIAREVLALAIDTDSASLDSLLAVTADMERLQDDLATDTARLEELRVEADAVAVRMNELFAAADVEFDQAESDYVAASKALAEQRAREEEERRRAEAAQRQRDAIRAALGLPSEGVPMSVTPGFICPIAAPNHFTNSWGAPRSGGRRHTGTDIMAGYRAPVVAVADGRIRLAFTPLGGNVVYLSADHGVEYFYAHLDGYAPGVTSGMRVSRGMLLGYNGDTGNAYPGAYHVHFGMRPGDIINVNPYPTLRAVCP